MAFKTNNNLKKALFEKMEKDIKAKEKNKKTYETDTRFWQLTKDDSGTGKAKIRFLPPKDGEDDAWVEYFRHSFQVNGRWYIEKSRTTLGEDDPVADYNTSLWKTENPHAKKLISGNGSTDSRTRKKTFVVNILVISDPANPQNNGKVFLFNLGVKLFDKIKEAMFPQEDADGDTPEPYLPFDYIDGADFNLTAVTVNKQISYDKSCFGKRKPLYDGDEDKLQEVQDQIHSLLEFKDPSTFKSYEELKKKLIKVIGDADDEILEELGIEDPFSKDDQETTSRKKRKEIPKKEEVKKPAKSNKKVVVDDDDDEDEVEEDDDEDEVSRLASMVDEDDDV